MTPSAIGDESVRAFLSQVLSWDYYKIVDTTKTITFTATIVKPSAHSQAQSNVVSGSVNSHRMDLKPIPLRFKDAEDYVNTFSSFVLEETQAQILKGSSNDISEEVSVKVMNRDKKKSRQDLLRGGGPRYAADDVGKPSVQQQQQRQQKRQKTLRTATTTPYSSSASVQQQENNNNFSNNDFFFGTSISFENDTKCANFKENDLVFLSKLNPQKDDEKIEKGKEFCFGFLDGKLSGNEISVRLFAPPTTHATKPGMIDGNNNNNITKKNVQSGGQQQQQQQRQVNEQERERLCNVRNKLMKEQEQQIGKNESKQTWHLTRVCNLSTITREWLAVHALPSISFSDLLLNTNNTYATTTPTPTPTSASSNKQKKENQYNNHNSSGHEKQQQQQQHCWEIPKDLIEAMTENSKADKAQFDITTNVALTKGNPITLIQGPPGTGKTTTIVSLLSVILAAQPINRNHVPKMNGSSYSRDYISNKKSKLSEEEEKLIRKKAQPWLYGLPNPRDCYPSFDLDDSSEDDIDDRNKFPPLPSSLPIELIGPNVSKRTKILVCAPSNSALDEIVRRVLERETGLLNESGNPYLPNVVRCGLNVHEDVAYKSLDHLISERISSDFGATNNNSALLVNGGSGGDGSKIFTAVIDRKRAKQAILDEAQIVFSTLSVAGSGIFSKISTMFDVIIVDEAAQAVEPSTLIPLANVKAKQVFLVGDPAQLPATILSKECVKNKYDQSLFKRLADSGFPLKTLTTQYRMLPEIREFPSDQFYNGELKDAAGLVERNSRPWHDCKLYKPFVFYDVKLGKEEPSHVGCSWVNHEEAEFAVELVLQMMKANPNLKKGGKVAIISPYSAQVSVILKALKNRFGDKSRKMVEVSTIDGAQGSEKEVVIFSVVRAPLYGLFQNPKKKNATMKNGNRRNFLGFVADERRMNVGLTRAKCSLFVLGNASAIKSDPNWGSLVESADKRGCTLSVPPRTQFRSFFSEHSQYHDSDLSGSEDDTDDASSLKSLFEDDYFDDFDRDISPSEKERLTIDRAAETRGYARHGFKDELVFEKTNKADVVGGDEDGFADDDDANVDAFAEVEDRTASKKASAATVAKKEEKKQPAAATKKRGAPAEKKTAAATTTTANKRSRR
jgi:senataxin